MTKLLISRLLQMIPTFLGITLLTFVIAQWAPGDPLQVDPERAAVHASAQPPLQYARWLERVLSLDFGTSLIDHRPVRAKLAEAFPQSFALASLALLLAVALSLPLGVYTARNPRGAPQRIIAGALFSLYSVPTYWVAVLWLTVFPFQGLGGAWWHGAIAVVVLAYPTLAVLSRQLRGSMIEALSQDYVRAARARGISERSILYRHAFRNALIPMLATLGALLPQLVGGAVVVERVFGISGMGTLALDAIGGRDYPTLMAATTLGAVATMFSTLIADLLLLAADPRLRIPAEAP